MGLRATTLICHAGALGFALLLPACGDDTENAVDAGGGGATSGGRGGGGGGGSNTGGHASPNCREDMRASLSVWCDKHKEECQPSLPEREALLCRTPRSTSNYYTVRRNSCDGYTISHVTGVDAWSRRYHYDGDGTLVGIVVQPFSFPCGRVLDYYGMDCERIGEDLLECDDRDAGQDAG